ncbi:UdgX family uracil-DNA binding protein [Streptoalloteichus hindustanus]|uniref:Type-4 uracil-DNA glycosylase n=1 Tax=Streptoalloteichus hindustanus TaxID=2017 RepID=A0A1M4U514_STRHI|nr:UdgX family uracil-DNA binding protein [Streptoalloteichus hindustanus]SHE51700.1 DNA polymerase [Streptoalloteichus hindustanus]
MATRGHQRSAADFLPPDADDLDQLRGAAAGCRGCDLYRDATQTVFGDGSPDARALLLGEQPGDREDVAGEPFVGPAGRLLDRALAEAGISRDQTYLTNAVKHFKFVPPERGKRRLHKQPSAAEVAACKPWLVAELRVVRPEVVVLLGATAGKALYGSSFRVGDRRGTVFALPEIEGIEGLAVATVHPSSVLRADDRDAAYAAFVADLAVVAEVLAH